MGLLAAPLGPVAGVTGGLANTMLGKGWNAVSGMWNSPRSTSGSAAP
jgi:hypothetical protein